ncbi:MAG: ABC transporter substrate-binding protein [Kineosporiaceae bacterium]
MSRHPSPTRRPARPARRLLALAAGMVLLATGGGLTACGSDDAAATSEGTVEIRYQGWANQVILAELAEDLGYFSKVKLTFVGTTISGPQDIQSVASKQVDVGGAFDGAVAKLALSGAPIKAVFAYYGSDKGAYNGFYVLENSPIKTARDLIGKKIGVNTLGGHNEAVIDTYLLKEGLSWSEVKQVQLVPLPPPNTDEALRKGQIDVAALTGQFRDQTKAKGGVREIFTDSQIFGDFSAGTQVFRKDFIAKHPEAVKDYVNGVGKALEWTKSQPTDAVHKKFEEIITKRDRNESTASIKYWKSAGVATPYGKIQDSDFTRWEDWLVQTGAIKKGELDVTKIYTNEYNPNAS